MIRITKLNIDDIKKIIAEKYKVDKNKINVSVYSASDDGFYHSGPSVFMEFEEQEDGNDKNNL